LGQKRHVVFWEEVVEAVGVLVEVEVEAVP
jgi:hypothetical protein